MDDIKELMRAYNKKLSEYHDVEIDMNTAVDCDEETRLIEKAISMFSGLNSLLSQLRAKGVDMTIDIVTKGFTLDLKQTRLAL